MDNDPFHTKRLSELSSDNMLCLLYSPPNTQNAMNATMIKALQLSN